MERQEQLMIKTKKLIERARQLEKEIRWKILTLSAS